jgi:hypothetical protein
MKDLVDSSRTIAILRSRLAQARPRLCRVVPAVAVICFLAWCYIAVRPDFDWDDASPEILNMAWRLTKGEIIYRGIDSPPYSFAAYTPLYYAVVSLPMRLTGLNYLPAKLVTLLFALSLGWAIVYLGRRWQNTARDGIWTAFLFFLIPAVLYNAARSHVQMMAVALSVWSLVFFLQNRWFPTLIVSPLLAVLAFYTKQTQVALPLAMVLYLALRNRRWLLPYVVTGAVAGLIPLVWLQKATGGYFLFNVLQLARLAYDVREIPPVLLHWLGPIFLFVAVAVLTLWRRFREARWEPIDFYLACLFLTTVVSVGRAGSHSQYIVELAAVVLLYLLRTTGLPSMKGRDVLVALQVLLLLFYTPAFVLLEEGPWDMASIRAAKKIYPLIDGGSGPILSQQGSFALFSRGEIYVQLFHFAGLSRAGLWDQRPLLKDIDDRTFSWVITEFPIEEAAGRDSDHERFTPEILAALRKNYQRREAIYPYYLYGPRAPDPALLHAAPLGK